MIYQPKIFKLLTQLLMISIKDFYHHYLCINIHHTVKLGALPNLIVLKVYLFISTNLFNNFHKDHKMEDK